MPRTSIGKSGESAKFRKLAILLNGSIGVDQKTPEKVGMAIGIGKTTAYRYLKNPEKMSLEKLSKLGRNLGIPIEELRDAAIRY